VGVQDETHDKQGDVDIFENHEEDLTGCKSCIRISHTARQNNKNQKEVSLKLEIVDKGKDTSANQEKIMEIV